MRVDSGPQIKPRCNFARDGELLRVMITNGNNMAADFEIYGMIIPTYTSAGKYFRDSSGRLHWDQAAPKPTFYLDQNSDECHLKTPSVQSQRRGVVWSQIDIHPKDRWVESKQRSFNNLFRHSAHVNRVHRNESYICNTTTFPVRSKNMHSGGPAVLQG